MFNVLEFFRRNPQVLGPAHREEGELPSLPPIPDWAKDSGFGSAILELKPGLPPAPIPLVATTEPPREAVPKVLILSGLPGCGKTTFAKRWVSEDPTKRERITISELRFGTLNRDNDRIAKDNAHIRATEAIEKGKSVVIDDTHLTQGARMRWLELAKRKSCDSEVFELDESIQTCVWRDSKRFGRDRVGRAVIHRMALLTGRIDWNQMTEARPFIICEIDNVIANTQHREVWREQRPMNMEAYWYQVISDHPKTQMIRLLKYLALHNNIIFTSHRPIDRCGRNTEDWLEKHFNNNGLEENYRYLFMRNAGDNRAEVEVKEELASLLPPPSRVAMVLDTDPAVISMWQAKGYETLKMGR